MWDDRYGEDVLANNKPRRAPLERRAVTLARGQIIEHSETEFCGAVVGAGQGFVHLEDWHGTVRQFRLDDFFMIEGESVTLQLPKAAKRPARTASGSFAAPASRARVARASRIFVEGRHDAELVERIWGDDLREVGVVVELLEGADHLAAVLRDFQPGPSRRAGVLLDHLVTGSKESRLAAAAVTPDMADFVRITGHPFIDIWQAVKPERLGMAAWPEIPYGTDWKVGICKHLGLPHAEQADIADAFARILSRVRDYRDLDPRLVGPVEMLIDFVTA